MSLVGMLRRSTTQLSFLGKLLARIVTRKVNLCRILHPDYTRQGLLVWKETKLKLSSVEGHRVDRPKLAQLPQFEESICGISIT